MKLFIVSVSSGSQFSCSSDNQSNQSNSSLTLSPVLILRPQPPVSIVCDRHSSGPARAPIAVSVQRSAIVAVVAIVQLRTPLGPVDLLLRPAVHRLQLRPCPALRTAQPGSGHPQARLRPCATPRAGIRRPQVGEEAEQVSMGELLLIEGFF